MIESLDGTLRVTAPMIIANARALLEAGRRSLTSSSPPAGTAICSTWRPSTTSIRRP
jgi:hypothetical protein